jgi:hypothetical protein
MRPGLLPFRLLEAPSLRPEHRPDTAPGRVRWLAQSSAYAVELAQQSEPEGSF